MVKADEIRARLGLTGVSESRIRSDPPIIPDHEMIRCIGRGSYGEVWLARNAIGTGRAIKIVCRDTFKDDRPYRREFAGIQKYEPISRSNEGLVDVLQIGQNEEDGYFYYVMELADPVSERPQGEAMPGGSRGSAGFNSGLSAAPENGAQKPDYAPRTLASDLKMRGRLPLEECITLGLTLNLALGQLHRHGLIHRDVKPSNIIFVNGVAKLADIGLLTGLADAKSFVGTEGFIPPEGPVSPQADIYALGKVLYEAAMGKDRNDFPELSSSVGLNPESKSLMELNAILLRACARDPKARYQTMEEMNADLALLHSGKSVQARHALERRLKAARRVGMVSIAALAMVVVPWSQSVVETMRARASAKSEMVLRLKADRAAEEARLARRQAEADEQRALTEAVKSQQVSALLTEMLEDVGPSKALGRDTTMLREILEKTAARLGDELPNQPEVESQLRDTIGEVWCALGQYDRAEGMFQAALTLRRKCFPNDNPLVADSLEHEARVLMMENQLSRAHEMADEALAARVKLFGKDNVAVAASLSELGDIFFREGNRAEAEARFRESLAMRQRLAGTETTIAESLEKLGDVLAAQGRLTGAESTYRDAFTRAQRIPGNDPSESVALLNKLGNVLKDQGKRRDDARLAEAEALHKQALGMARKVLGEDHPLVERSLNDLVEILKLEHKVKAADDLCRADLSAARRRLPAEDPQLAPRLVRLSGLLRKEGETLEAETRQAEALGIARKIRESNPALAGDILARIGVQLREARQFAAAEVVCRESLERASMTATQEPARWEECVCAVGDCLKGQNKWAEAEHCYRGALASAREFAIKDLPRLERRVNDLADLLQYEGQLPEAEKLFQEAIALKRKRVGDEARDLGLLYRSLGYVFQREGNLAGAASALRESLRIAEKRNSPEDAEDAAWALYGLAWVVQMQGNLDEAESLARKALSVRRELSRRMDDALPVAESLYQLAVVLWSENKYLDAEKSARECLGILGAAQPGCWQEVNCRSTLAGILIEEKQYAEAEPLLLSAYCGLDSPENKSDAALKPRLKETVGRLARLCDETARETQAAEWRNKLCALD